MTGDSVRTALAILTISIGCATISAAAVYDSCAAAARHAVILNGGSSSSTPSAPSGTYLIRSLASSSDVALTHCDMGVDGQSYGLVSEFGQLKSIAGYPEEDYTAYFEQPPIWITQIRSGEPTEFPAFGGSHGPETLKGLQDIESDFQRQVAILAGLPYNILDVKNTEFHEGTASVCPQSQLLFACLNYCLLVSTTVCLSQPLFALN